MVEHDPVKAELDSIFEEVKRQVQDILGTMDFDIDRDKLWELELFFTDTRIIEAASRGDPNALMAVVEFRERIIDRRYPIDAEYKRKKQEIDERYTKELVELSRKAQSSEYYARRYDIKFFEWIMERVRLQDEHMRSMSRIKIVAAAFLGKQSENDMVLGTALEG